MKNLTGNNKTTEHLPISEYEQLVLSDTDKTLWLNSCEKITESGYGTIVSEAYAKNSKEIVQRVGIESTLKLSDLVSLAAIKSGKKAAELISKESFKVVEKLENNPSQFHIWLSLIEQVIKLAPKSTSLVLENMDHLLAQLNLDQLENWILTGFRSAGTDSEKQLSYFSFETPESQRWLEYAAGSIDFSSMSNEIKAYLGALWNLHIPIRERHLDASGNRVRRAGFSSGHITVPSSFPGFQGEEAIRLFRASVAHIGAHLIYSGPRSTVDQLKPLQIALISLIEDARVEQLAMKEWPGLLALWKPFHIAKAKGSQTANHLFVRLARALIDPDYEDHNHWVNKGKKLFYDHETQWRNPAISREIGGILANDLGQMRIQFNVKTYFVEPPYRDDNMGLWDFRDQDTSESATVEELLNDADQDQNDNDTTEPNNETTHNTENEGSTSPVELIEEDNLPVTRYPEYDYVTEQSRPEWTTIVEPSPELGSACTIEAIIDKQAYVVNRLRSLMSSTKVSRPQKIRGQLEGEFLDIDACITAVTSRRIGENVDARVYANSIRKHRDLSIQVLLDVSESTNDKIIGSNESVLELERQSSSLLAHAISGLGDPFSIAAFCSNKKDEVRYYRVKDFKQPYNDLAKSRLAGLKGSGSTRMGTAIRHAASDLKKETSHRRLILIVTDGEPSDIDVSDPHYLVEDARHAVFELSKDGINVFCVGLDSGGEKNLTRIFGKRNLILIDSLTELPEKLPLLYFRLTT